MADLEALLLVEALPGLVAQPLSLTPTSQPESNRPAGTTRELVSASNEN